MAKKLISGILSSLMLTSGIFQNTSKAMYYFSSNEINMGSYPYAEKVKNCFDHIIKDIKNINTTDSGRQNGLLEFQEFMKLHKKWLDNEKNLEKWESNANNQFILDMLKENASILNKNYNYASKDSYDYCKSIVLDVFEKLLKYDKISKICKGYICESKELVKQIKKDSVKIDDSKANIQISTKLINQSFNWGANIIKSFDQSIKDKNNKIITFEMSNILSVLPVEEWGRLAALISNIELIMKIYLADKIK
ncbi:MAG: hypothetical protein J6P21_01695 [Clostridia bacterium]|nr:hypothetical protein [Clostridia bacterium]